MPAARWGRLLIGPIVLRSEASREPMSSRIRSAALEVSVALAGRVARFFPPNQFARRLAKLEQGLAISVDQTPRLKKLGARNLGYLDVGARDGPPRLITHYAPFVEMMLVEPERQEAERLRHFGYTVTQKALGAAPGTTKLHITAQVGASSLRTPGDAVFDFASRASDHVGAPGIRDRLSVVETQDVELTTVAAISAERGSAFDYIKIDTQGSEYEVIQGIGDAWPMFIGVEVSLFEYYRGQKTFYDLAPLLYDRGYLLWAFDFPLWRTKGSAMAEPTLPGLPLHGDAAFMPDWMRPRGRELIVGRERAFAAWMMMFGMADLLHTIVGRAPFADAEAIHDALRVPAPKRFRAGGFAQRVRP